MKSDNTRNTRNTNNTNNTTTRQTAIAAGQIFLTEAQLAKRWQISVKKLQADRWNFRGVAYVKIGRSVRYRLADVLAFEELNIFPPPRGPGGTAAAAGVR